MKLPLVLATLLCGAAAAAAAAQNLDLAIGKAVFDRIWVPAPSSTKSADGLGPLFVERSCAACHPRGGARADFAPGRDGAVTTPGLVIRLATETGAPHEIYGAELQMRGAGGQAGEGEARVSWQKLTPKLATLLEPDWTVAAWAYGAPEEIRVSARVAPALHGVGLLATVPDEAVLALADPDDRDRDGISGRAHRVTGPGGEEKIGRFGWKAAEPTLDSQIAAAFALDMGLSTPQRPDPAGDCTAAQTACRGAPHGDGPGAEVPESLLGPLKTFVAGLKPPASRAAAPGERLFAAAGCAACHRPELPTADGGVARAYTDLLLLAVGAGLDDALPEGDAAPAEWRTAPLWGIREALARGSGLLHDGRARTITEAVLWHGGEAAAARDRVAAQRATERGARVEFVEGL